MILVDTSIWVDHLRAGDPLLAELLESAQVMSHPFVIGELALGSLRQRTPLLSALSALPQAPVAAPDEVLHFIERHQLDGQGIGYVDVHLLAAVRLHGAAVLWTRDKRLHQLAEMFGWAMNEDE